MSLEQGFEALRIANEDRAAQEWSKFEKVEGLLKTTNKYLNCYASLIRNGDLVVIGSHGDSKPTHRMGNDYMKASSAEEKLNILYAQAELAQKDLPDLCKKLETLAEHVSPGPMKARERVTVKRDQDYGGDALRVIDLVRCSAILSSLGDAKEIVQAFKKPNGMWSGEWEFVRCKDGFEHADNFLVGGYRDVKANVRHVATGHVVEIQLHLESFYDIKKKGGHKHYTFSRTLKVDGVTNAVSILAGCSRKLNWMIAEVGEDALEAVGNDPAARYPIERRLGELYASMWAHGEYAIVKYDAALRHCEAAFGKDSVEVFQVLMELVYCVSEMQRHSDRPNMQSNDKKWMSMDLIPMIDRAIDGLTKQLYTRHPFTMKAMRIKADVYDTIFRADLAKPLYYEVLRLQKEVLGTTHPDTIETLNNFGDVLTDDYDNTFVEGYSMYQAGLDGALKRMDPNHPTPRMLVANMRGVLEDDLKLDRKLDRGDEKMAALLALMEEQYALNAMG